MSQLEIDDAEWAKPENWRGGMFYFSRRDRALTAWRSNDGRGFVERYF